MDISDISSIRLAIDTGLLVLIWMVQLVIYPGFKYMSKVEMDIWHPIYTQRITAVVMPLMLGQVGLHALHIWYASVEGPTTWLAVVLIASAWLVTFTRAVPLHHSMSSTTDVGLVAHKLVVCNWYRTVAWTGVWAISCLQML